MIRYVVGFPFNEQKDKVILVSKLRPHWMKGFFNGIGGKIEEGETPIETMHRECKEETGLSLNWICKGFMEGINDDGTEFKCHIFYAYSDIIYRFRQIEDEQLRLYSVSYALQHINLLNCLPWLLPFGRYGEDRVFITMNYRKGEKNG